MLWVVTVTCARGYLGTALLFVSRGTARSGWQSYGQAVCIPDFWVQPGFASAWPNQPSRLPGWPISSTRPTACRNRRPICVDKCIVAFTHHKCSSFEWQRLPTHLTNLLQSYGEGIKQHLL